MSLNVEPAPQHGGVSWRWYLALCGFSVVVGYLVFMHYPVVYGGDPIVRLTNWEHLRLAYQLPLFQAVVHAVTRLSPHPLLLRVVLAVISALGACGMARLAAVAFGEESGPYAGLLFGSSHFLIFLGNAPYQEMLELALLLWALALIFGATSKAAQTAGYLLLAAACWTRYEAWFAALAGALVQVIHQRPRPLRALLLALPFSIGPLAWIAANGGLSPAGTLVLDSGLRLARLWRIPYVLGASLYHTNAIVALLALFGFITWWRDPGWKRNLPALEILPLAAALFLLALPFSAHGVEPDPDRYVTNREVHFLLPCWFLLAAGGLRWFRIRLRGSPVLPAALVFLLVFAYEGYATKKILDQSVNEGNLQLDVQLTWGIATRLGPGQSALIFARPFAPEETQRFLEMVRRGQGEAGVQAAREMMSRMNIWPMDYARIWVYAPQAHAAWLRERLVRAQEAATLPREAALAVVFDDYTPASLAEQALLEQARLASSATKRYPPRSPGSAGATMYFLPKPQAQPR